MGAGTSRPTIVALVVVGAACSLHAAHSWASTANLPDYCEVMPQAAGATVVVTPNDTGICRDPLGTSANFPCERDRQVLVDVTWGEPPIEPTPILRCVLANSERAAHGGGVLECIPLAPAGCFMRIIDVEAFAGDTEIQLSPRGVTCGYEPTGDSHPSTGTIYVEDSDGTTPGNQPAVIGNAEYCMGLALPPGDPTAPWAASRCCRQQFDFVFTVAPEQQLTRVRFIASPPFEIRGSNDFRFAPSMCGDGIRHCHEECDDGNSENLDTCSNDCEIRDWGCGRPVSTVGAEPGASDALFILRAATGLEHCGCLCDVEDSGATTATDALLVLQAAIGSAVALACDRCPRGNGFPGGSSEVRRFLPIGLEPSCTLDLGFERMRVSDGGPERCDPSGRCVLCNDGDGALLYPTREQCEATLDQSP